jgi:hypothetical protein
MATIIIGPAGPHAGAVLVVPIDIKGADVMRQLNRQQRAALTSACVHETRAATFAPVTLPGFRGPVGDIAVAYALGLLSDGRVRWTL